MTELAEAELEVDAPAPDPVVITEPGVYEDLDEIAYHADPVPGVGSLSNSGAKRLLPPSVPAIFKWERDHGRPDKRAFDFGHAAHKEVLGVGAQIVAVDATDWRTKIAKEAAIQIRADGGVPLLAHEVDQVRAMAAVLRQHPIASKLLAPQEGTPEASLFWRDEPTGVMLRSRLDFLPHPRADGRLIVVDYKSTVNANPVSFGKFAADYGYFMQDPFYRSGIRALGIADDVAFVFVAQEKTPPYLISVLELDAEAVRLGEQQMRKAIEIFRDCSETDLWPGYTDDVELVSLPPWFVRRLEEEY